MPAETALKQRRVTTAQFDRMLAGRPEDARWELVDGRVIKGMVGGRWMHHRIIRRLDYLLQHHFETTGRTCSTFTETFYLKEPSLDLSALPDLMVRCGPLPPDATSLSDPIVAVEILSPDTEERDRLDKWASYSQLPSLQHYLLIARDKVLVEGFDRKGKRWIVRKPLTQRDAKLSLIALDFSVALDRIYPSDIG